MPLRFREPAVLATDPKIRQVGDQEVCELYVFIKDVEKTADGRKDKPIPFEVWGKQGRAAYEHLGKGSLVMVDGTFNHREYEKDGETIGVWFGAGRVDFVRIKRDGQYVDGAAARPADPDDTRTPEERAADEDIPF